MSRAAVAVLWRDEYELLVTTTDNTTATTTKILVDRRQ